MMMMEVSMKGKKMGTILWITLLSFMMFIARVHCVTFPRDNYMIYVYPFYFYDTTDLYVQRGDIPAIASNSHEKTVLYHKDSISIEALDMDVENGGMYMFDSQTKCIYYLVFINKQKFQMKSKHCGVSTSTDVSIAYDWVSKNIYWTDPHFGWIAVQPVSTTDKTMFKTINLNNNQRPGALAVDPLKGYLFWFDSSKDGERIERSFLSGNNRTTIITTESNCVEDIVADVTSQRIYWVDSCRFALEYADYDGNNRNILYRRDHAYFHDLAIDKDYVCTTLPKERKFVCVNKATGSVKIDRVMRRTSPRTISIFNLEKQPQRTDLCLTEGCEHFCVNNPEGAVCLCKEGYSLNADKKTCKADHNLFSISILISNTTNICMLDFRALTGNSQTLKCFVGGLKDAAHIGIDTDDRVIYYAEQATNTISSYNTITGSKTALYTTGKVSGLACDWIDKNLYWSESDTNKIRVISIRTKDSKSLRTANGQPSSLVVDPHNKTLFWIEKSSSSYQIIATSLDGINRKVVVASTNLKKPSGLYFNTKDNRLYFLDDGILVSVKDDGSDSSHIMYMGSSDLLIIYKNYALWSTSRGNRLKSTLLDASLSSQRINLKDIGKVTGLSVFDPALQPIEKGPCDAFNGGCEHICIAISDGRACMCNFGFYLGADGTSCQSNITSSNFLLASDTTQNKIYQVSLKNGGVVGLDIPGAENPLSVVFDKRTNSAIWSQSTGHIMKANLDGTNMVKIYTGAFEYSDQLAIDNTNGFLYFSSSNYWNYEKNKICVMDPVSSLTKTLVKNLVFVPGLALHPSKGYIFYVHLSYGRRNTRYTIRRTYMDGTGNKDLIRSSARKECLTIDYAADRLYWIETGNIKSSTLSLSDQKTVVNNDFDISNVLISNGLVYYTAAKLLKIGRYTLSSITSNEFMENEPEMGIINSIDVYDGYSMPVNDLCKVNRQGCSTFCLPKSSSYICGCEDGTALMSDGKTCKGVKKCSGSIQNGAWKNDCGFFQYQFCSFTCDTGFIPTLSTSRVMCQNDGSWEHDLSILCKASRTTTPKVTTTTAPATTTLPQAKTTSTTLKTTTTSTTSKPTTTTTTTIPTTTTTTTKKPTTTTKIPTTTTTTTKKPTTTTKIPTTTTTTTKKPTTTTKIPTTTTTTTTTIPTTTTTTTKKPTTTTKIPTTTTTTTKKPTTTTKIPTTTTTTTKKPTTTTKIPTTTTTTTTTIPTTTTTTTKKPTTTTKIPTTTTTTTEKPTTTTKIPTTTTTTTQKPTTTTKIPTTTTKKPTTTTKIPTTTTTTTKKPTTTTTSIPRTKTTTTTKNPTTTTTTTIPTTTTTTGLENLCDKSILNGELEDTCTRKPGLVCRFTCNDRYVRAIVDHTITCLNTGQWSKDPKKLCQQSKVLFPNVSAQKGDDSPVYAGVGGGIAAVIVVVVIVVLLILYLKRRARKDGPKVYMRRNEGFENPSYDSVQYSPEQLDNEFNDGGFVNMMYGHMHGSQSSTRKPRKTDSVSSATTVSSYGGKKLMRGSTYIDAPHDRIIAPDDHIYDSIRSAAGVHSRRNSDHSISERSSRRGSKKDSPESKTGNKKSSPQRQDSKDRVRKSSHKRSGGVQALQEMYSPPSASQGYSPNYYVYEQPQYQYWNTAGLPPRRYSLQYDNEDSVSMQSDYSYGKDSTSRILPKKR